MQNKASPLSVCGVNMRTTSSLESLHSALGRSFPKHPHIFRFSDRLRLCEFSKLLNMLDLVKDDVPDQQFQRRRLRDQQREEKIRFFTDQLLLQKISVGEFLEAIANKEVLPNVGMIFVYHTLYLKLRNKFSVIFCKLSARNENLYAQSFALKNV